MPTEWHYDPSLQRLYYAPNASGAAAATPPPTSGFASTGLATLINVSGTPTEPARGIAIEGLAMRDTSATYLAPHGLPSGGDWALQRQGALTLVGTEGLSLRGNLFTSLDGNAVFIGGYHRGLRIEANEFAGIGDSVLAAWGDTSECLNEDCSKALPAGVKMGPDGRGGEQPLGTLVRGNLAREIGLWQKQSSFWFQAVSAQTLLEGNVFFNGPRAALNFNDGFGGGDEVVHNLLLNTCRESSDHGPWNSWDRVPYITTIRTGKPSITPATREVHHNFILGNYNSQEAMDTDDGSAYLHTHSNVMVYGDNGLKSDFGGHDHVWEDNLLYYVGFCYGAMFTTFDWQWPGYNDGFRNNTCVFRGSYESDCDLDPSFAANFGQNRVFSADGTAKVCRGKVDFADWQAQGHDTETTLGKWPADAQLVAQAKSMLSF